MASIEHLADQTRNISAVNTDNTRGYPADSIRFDTVMMGLVYWFLLGLYLDGGAHQRGLVDDTFFTPWHALLYSGAMSVGLLLGFTQIRNMLRGHTALRALPYGYLPAFIGIGIFSVGGVLDLVWHTLFGIEAGMQALLSPSHLILASGSFLFISAPLSAAWKRQASPTWRTLLPALLSLAAIFAHLTFFTQYANFATRPNVLINLPPDIDNYFFNLYGVVSLLFPSILGMSVILLVLRRWSLPLGSITLIMAINTALMIWLRLPFLSGVLPALIAVPVGGVLADIFLWRFRPSAERSTTLRVFAFSIPFATSLLYLLILNSLDRGLWWQIHMWLGVPFLTGIAGLFVSFLTVPPTATK
jgi:hypothetical protein